MDSSSESVVSSLGSFAEMLSDPEGYDPERLKSLSVGVPSLLPNLPKSSGAQVKRLKYFPLFFCHFGD